MKMKQIAKYACLGGLSLGTVLTTGCASIVGGANQSISVETRSTTGEAVVGANCKLENPKGTWFVTTPGSVIIHRAYDDLTIYCTKTGEQPGIATAKSSTKGMAFGNILFGGPIGVGVDAATGAAYDYPTLITVQLGETKTIKALVNGEQGTPATGTPSAAPAAANGGASSGQKSATVPVDTAGTAKPSSVHSD